MTGEVERWLQSLPDPAIEDELDQLRRQRRTLDRKIEIREQALAMKRSLGEGNADASDRPRTGIREMNPPFRGREAIRKVLAATPEKRTWTIAEMLKAILDRGWVANTHAVQVNLSRMYRDGELAKAGLGVYCLPDAERELPASPEEVQE